MKKYDSIKNESMNDPFQCTWCLVTQENNYYKTSKINLSLLKFWLVLQLVKAEKHRHRLLLSPKFCVYIPHCACFLCNQRLSGMEMIHIYTEISSVTHGPI